MCYDYRQAKAFALASAGWAGTGKCGSQVWILRPEGCQPAAGLAAISGTIVPAGEPASPRDLAP